MQPARGYTWMPVLHYQSKNGNYIELRYNYEDYKTASVFAGKRFSGGNNLQYEITPMVGLSAGIFTGYSLAGNFNASWKSFFVSVESQYSISGTTASQDFFFNWSELGYNLHKNFFIGTSVQYTAGKGYSQIEPGLFAGFEAGNVSVPVYLFHSGNRNSLLVIGVSYEFKFEHKQKNNKG